MKPPEKITTSDVRELAALAGAYADARWLDQLLEGSAAGEIVGYDGRKFWQIAGTNTTRAAHRLAYAAAAIFGVEAQTAVASVHKNCLMTRSEFENALTKLINEFECSNNEEPVGVILSYSDKHSQWNGISFTSLDKCHPTLVPDSAEDPEPT